MRGHSCSVGWPRQKHQAVGSTSCRTHRVAGPGPRRTPSLEHPERPGPAGPALPASLPGPYPLQREGPQRACSGLAAATHRSPPKCGIISGRKSEAWGRQGLPEPPPRHGAPRTLQGPWGGTGPEPTAQPLCSPLAPTALQGGRPAGLPRAGLRTLGGRAQLWGRVGAQGPHGEERGQGHRACCCPWRAAAAALAAGPRSRCCCWQRLGLPTPPGDTQTVPCPSAPSLGALALAGWSAAAGLEAGPGSSVGPGKNPVSAERVPWELPTWAAGAAGGSRELKSQHDTCSPVAGGTAEVTGSVAHFYSREN